MKMKHIWGLFIVGLAVLATTEARRHHSKRTTSTTTEGSTTVQSSTNATIDKFQNSTLSIIISTVPTNLTETKNKTSDKKHSHESTTVAPSSTTAKSHKTTVNPSHSTTHPGNTTSSNSTTTPKPTKATKRLSKLWKKKSKSKTTTPSNKHSSSTTPTPIPSSTTNSTNSTKASGKSSTPTTHHHLTTATPTKAASANATKSANTSTTAVPLVTTKNTESAKHGHESSKSSHKTTKSSVTSTTPQPSTTSNHTSHNTTATTAAKTKATTSKSHDNIHATTPSTKTTSKMTHSTNVTTHSTNHTATTKPISGNTTPKPTTIKPSKVTKPSKAATKTTIPKPATVRPTASMNVTSHNSSTTIHANATTPHPKTTTKQAITSKGHHYHATTPAHLPTSSATKSATVHNTTGKPMTNSTHEISSLTTTSPRPTVMKGTTKKPSFLETLKHLTHLGSHVPEVMKGTTKHPPLSNSTHKSNLTIPATKATTVPISTTAYTMPKFSYVVNDKKTGVPCVLSKMSISMSITYKKSDNAIADGTMVVPNNALTDGTCTEETTEMKLMWSAPRRRKRESGHNGLNTVILNFVSNGKVSSLDSMLFEFFLDNDHFPGAVDKVLKRNTTKGLGLFTSTVNLGHYICDVETSISADDVKITIADVSLIAFNKDKNLNAKKVEKCTVKVGFKKIAVIGGAVGVVALVSALGAYIWCSKRRRDNSTLP